MRNNLVKIDPESFIRILDYVVHMQPIGQGIHGRHIELAHFNLADSRPLGNLTDEPCYTLCGQEKGASLSKMFDLANNGGESDDLWIKKVFSLSEGWKRQILPEGAFEYIESVVKTYVELRKKDLEISEFGGGFHGSPDSHEEYFESGFLQSAQVDINNLESQRERILLRLRSLEQKVINEHGFDLEKYPTINYGGSLGNSIPFKMDHVMDEAEIHAIDYYFNPTPFNSMVFNILKPIHDKEAKKLIEIVDEYKKCVTLPSF